jgi:hypothetical protein
MMSLGRNPRGHRTVELSLYCVWMDWGRSTGPFQRMAGTWWTWKQSVSERLDTRVRRRREFPDPGKARLAMEDMTEGARRFEGRNKGARFGSRSDGGNETAHPLPSELERTSPTTLSEPPSPIVPPPPRPQRPAAVSPASTHEGSVQSYGFRLVSPPSTNSRSERAPLTLGPQQGQGPRGCDVLVSLASLVAVVGLPCLVDKCTRRHGREQTGKLRKEVRVFRTARFIVLIFSLQRIQAKKEELVCGVLRRQTSDRTGTFLDFGLGSRRSTVRNL